MSSRIDISLRPSAWVGTLAATPWIGLTAFNAMLAHAYNQLFLLLSAVSIAGAVYQWLLNGRLSLGRSVTGLTLGDRGLEAHRRNGERYTVVPQAATRLYPGLIILKLRPEEATYGSDTVLLWSSQTPAEIGNVPGEQHRLLRVWLRLGFAPEPGEKSY